MLKHLSAIAIAAAVAGLTLTGAACAQTAPAPAAASATAPVSPEKMKLIQRILELWHVDDIGLVMLKNPVAESLRQSRSLLQGRVSTETQEATMKDIAKDAQQFMDSTTPIVKASAKKLIPTTVVPMLAQNFTEDELRQIIAILESKIKAKFEALAPDMEKALGEKVAIDAGPQVNSKLHDLTVQIGERMHAAVTPH